MNIFLDRPKEIRATRRIEAMVEVSFSDVCLRAMNGMECCVGVE